MRKPAANAGPCRVPATRKIEPTTMIASGTLAAGGITSRIGSFGWSWWTPWIIQCSFAPIPSSGSKWKTMRCSQYSNSVHTQ